MALDTTTGRKLRSAPDQIKTVLQKLDDQAAGAAATHARKHERFSYRVSGLRVEFPQSMGNLASFAVPSRNISREGVSFLMDHFVYPGSPCKVYLVTLQNQSQAVSGKIARCRYLQGSGTLHEVGVRFDRPIDVSLFHRESVRLRVVAAEPDRMQQRLLEGLLKPVLDELTCVASGEELFDRADSETCDLVLCELDLPEQNGCEAIRKLRAGGFIRPIIALSSRDDEQVRRETLEAGATTFVAKPLARGKLLSAVHGLQREPLLSTLANDSGLVAMIDEFVAQIPQRLTELEVALANNNYPEAATMLVLLREQAVTAGFAGMGESAAEVERALSANSDAGLVRTAVNELGRVALAARPVRWAVQD